VGVDDSPEILITKSDFDTSASSGAESLVLTKSSNEDASSTFPIHACELELKTTEAK